MEGRETLCCEEDNNFVRAVMGGGEIDDRESWVIEDEMDRLRIGGCSTHE